MLHIFTGVVLFLWIFISIAYLGINANTHGSAFGSKITSIIFGILLYLPVLLCFLYIFKDWSFWSMDPKKVGIFFFILITFFLYKVDFFQNSIFTGVSKYGYSIQSDKIYYNGEVISEELSNVVEPLDNENLAQAQYIKDASHVYYKGKILSNADPNTIKFFASDDNYHYLKDKSFVFNYKNAEVLPEADPKTFQRIPGPFGVDKTNVYYLPTTTIVKDADPETFQVISDPSNTSDSMYATDKNHVFFNNTLIQGASPQNAKVIESHYLISKDAVFYKENKIQGADPSSFSVIDTDKSISKDSHAVYWKNESVAEADPESFSYDEKSVYYKDKNSFYIGGYTKAPTQLSTLNPKTSEALGRHYFKENEDIYFVNIIDATVHRVDADPKTFKSISAEESTEYDALDDKGKFKKGNRL